MTEIGVDVRANDTEEEEISIMVNVYMYIKKEYTKSSLQVNVHRRVDFRFKNICYKSEVPNSLQADYTRPEEFDLRQKATEVP